MVTVLIVDDSLTYRKMILDILQPYGLQVIEANNGQEAIEKIQTHLPQLVITDLVMPGGNGYELCRWIKQNPDTSKIPVLLCSTKGEEFDRYWGLKQGADDYLTKPFSAPDLLKSVKNLLSKHKASSE